MEVEDLVFARYGIRARARYAPMKWEYRMFIKTYLMERRLGMHMERGSRIPFQVVEGDRNWERWGIN